MKGPIIHSATLRWATRNVAEIMNMSREEFEEWILADAPDLPEGRDIKSDEMDWMYGLFQRVATVARQAIDGDIDPKQVVELNRQMERLFAGETGIIPTVAVSGDFTEDDRQFHGREPWMWWRGHHIKETYAFLPLNLITEIIAAIETLCGQRRKDFAVCCAPKPRAPGEVCNKLFLTTRADAIYCSQACRKRAHRRRT